MNRGLIFSGDALFAMAIALALLSALLLVSQTDSQGGKEQMLSGLTAGDDALQSYYSASNEIDTPIGSLVNCREMLEYYSNGVYTKTIKCEGLE